jgi:hypothetical protein
LQTDLKTVQTDPAVTVYENAAWAPARAVLPDDAAAASRSGTAQALQTAPVAGAPPVLPGSWNGRMSGPLPGGHDIYVAAARSGHWHLSVAGQTLSARPAFGSAMAFAVPQGGGKGVLRFHTPMGRYVLILIEVAFWVVAIGIVITDRRRRPLEQPTDADRPSATDWADATDWFETIDLEDRPVPVPRHRPRRIVEPVGVDDDEVWR